MRATKGRLLENIYCSYFRLLKVTPLCHQPGHVAFRRRQKVKVVEELANRL